MKREHRLPTLTKATRLLDQEALKVYSQNYLLRCSDRQQELCTSRISFQRLGTADLYAVFYNEQFRTTTMCDIVQGNVTFVNKILAGQHFPFQFFPQTIRSKIYYHCIAALYINTTVSFKSSITKNYFCWPPNFRSYLIFGIKEHLHFGSTHNIRCDMSGKLIIPRLPRKSSQRVSV